MPTFLLCLLMGSPRLSFHPIPLAKSTQDHFLPLQDAVCHWVAASAGTMASWGHFNSQDNNGNRMGSEWLRVMNYYFPSVTSACLWGRRLLSIHPRICCTHLKLHQACGRSKRIRCVEMKHRMFLVFKLPYRCYCFSKYQFKKFEIDKMAT